MNDLSIQINNFNYLLNKNILMFIFIAENRLKRFCEVIFHMRKKECPILITTIIKSLSGSHSQFTWPTVFVFIEHRSALSLSFHRCVFFFWQRVFLVTHRRATSEKTEYKQKKQLVDLCFIL